MTPLEHEMNQRPSVIIESPYASDIPRNTEYARRCLRDSWDRGEWPFASHTFYPLFLSEEKERELGLYAGYRHWGNGSIICFYMDYGMSNGMKQALLRAMELKFTTDFRMIGQNATVPPWRAGGDANFTISF